MTGNIFELAKIPYAINQRQVEADNFGRANGIWVAGQAPIQWEVEAIRHTMISATLAYDQGSRDARNLGYLNEINSQWDARNGALTAHERFDTFRDLWNNNVGRQIAEFAVANGLPRSAINDLVLSAYHNGAILVNFKDGLTPGRDGAIDWNAWNRIQDPRVDINFSGYVPNFNGSVCD